MSESEHFPIGSAPEQVDYLQHLWNRLPEEQQLRVGCKWVDLSVRSILPEGFERFGEPGLAAVIRTLPPITDRAALQFAKDSLTSLKTPNEPADLLAAFFSVAASLEQLVRHFQIYECAFLAVMTSRLVHGDDRVMHSLIEDLRPAP